jgi:hypothetical protein
MKTRFVLIGTVANVVTPMAGLAQSFNTENNLSKSERSEAIQTLTDFRCRAFHAR